MSSTIESRARAIVAINKQEQPEEFAAAFSELANAVADADKDPADNERWREAAKTQHESEGFIEIDDDAVVSHSENGAYVAAWVFAEADD